jgi:pyruvate dehydrogenase E2 component (dihydrolipoamide acetyltransferase)
MERVFTMPDLGEGLEEGRIVEWLVATGDEVALNQPLVEVETAKAAVEIPSPFAGRVATLHGEEGNDVPVGEPLVTFEVEGSATPPPSHAKATPPVRRLAKELGVDLASVTGTGPGDRITERDVAQAAPLRAQAYTDVQDGETQRIEVSGWRREIADVLTRQAAVPQVTTFRTVDCSALQTLRDRLGVSPLPIFVAALVRVSAEHRELNAVWGGDHVENRRTAHVGIAVDVTGGLIVPVVHGAASLGIGALSGEIRRLAEAARKGKLHPDDLTGATIAVSNTGSYGSEAGTPILSPGTAVTLAFGVIAPRALVVDGEVVARPAATISLTFDHRVLDGATAGRALTDLVALLESAEGLEGLPR